MANTIFVREIFSSVYAPSDLPIRMSAAIRNKRSPMKEKAATIGLLPIDPPSIADTQKYLAVEREKWGSLVKKLDLEGSQ